MSGPTSPDEFQKQMQDLLQKQFKTFGTPGFAGAEPTGTVTQAEPEPAPTSRATSRRTSTATSSSRRRPKKC